MEPNASLKIAFPVGGDSRSTRRSIEAVCALAGVQPVAVLLDTAPVRLRRRRKMGEGGANLGIVPQSRIFKPAIFRVPRLGCLNLHQGKVPEYRGTPPGFWELYNGERSAGVTVHFVDQGLDTGPIVATGSVDIESRDTPATLIERRHVEGSHVLAEAVCLLRDGKAQGGAGVC
jgi:methionyl-tRNA formyltransferase